MPAAAQTWLVTRTDGIVTALAGRFATRADALAVANIYNLWLPFTHRVIDARHKCPPLADAAALDWTMPGLSERRHAPRMTEAA